MNAIDVFDIDGCLVDSLHRYKTLECGTKIDLPYWRKHCTPEKIAKDTLLPLVNFYKSLVGNKKRGVIIATARVMSRADWKYMHENLNGWDYFIHRLNDNDARRGFILKCQGILKWIKEKEIMTRDLKIWDDNLEQLGAMKNVLDFNGFNVEIEHIPSQQGH